MSVVRLWVYQCCKMVGGTSCWLGVGCTIKINNAKGTRSKKLKGQDSKAKGTRSKKLKGQYEKS